ncbi:PAS domain S-box protein [Rhodocytophaga rosea]|uniref:histidine kinase n=1 Tax=Rhodocytophaga rosea TaxID=2704465 RepID=A0A6C0GUN3_9BACT|nr:ATP-binding protein [Rhodocytophaga rosea]QHT71052.1 PAS domain S-box protein [Rhodocytophaga rosea]
MKIDTIPATHTVSSTYEEEKRLNALKSYFILDTPPEEELDALTRLAAYICNCPVSLITLIDADRQWIKSKQGMDVTETVLEISFCKFTIKSDQMLEVFDATTDERFSSNPMVTGDPHIQYYCGMPLITPEGYRLGSLCVINYKPSQLNSQQKQALQILAGEVMARMELKKQKKQLELEKKRLAESENRYRQLIENIEGFIFTHDLNGVILSVNQKMAATLGYTQENLVGKNLQTILSEEVKCSCDAYLQQFNQTKVASGMMQIVTAHKQEMFWLYRNFKYQDERKQTYIICSAQDITEKELARQMLQQSKEELENIVQLRTSELINTNEVLEKTRAELDLFVYRASHDLLGPLCSLKGLLTIARLQQNQISDNEPDYVTLMWQTVNKLHQVLNGLLTYSNNTHFSLEYKPIDMEAVIKEEFLACQRIEGFNRVRLTTHIEAAQPFYSDEERIRIIFKSLFSNSITFQSNTVGEPAIHVSVNSSSEKAVFVIRDNGVGISKNAIPQVFNLFSKSASHSKGPGLGLFIVKEVLKKLDGQIEVESQEGKGTRFMIEIPNQFP